MLHLPIVLLHQNFISIFYQVLLLCHTIAFPADLYKTRKLILPEVPFRPYACRKIEFSFTVNDWHVKGGPEKRVYAQHFFSALNAMHASPPSIIYICRTAIKSKCKLRKEKFILLGKFPVKKNKRLITKKPYLTKPTCSGNKKDSLFYNRSSVG